ncbi:AlbA family DNA-binding domain-containing protein [Deinococcus sp. UYEF24]
MAITTRGSYDPRTGGLRSTEGNWHDFKQSTHDGVDKLQKDFVALANTPGGPYQGYGYLIIGVSDTGEVVGLQGSEARLDVDKRTNQLKDTIKANISPYIDVQVLDQQIEGKTVHIVVVPQAERSWHMVNTGASAGYWVRRGWSSDRPTYSELLEQELRLVRLEVGPIQEKFTSLEARLHEQRDILAALSAGPRNGQQEKHMLAAPQSAAQFAAHGFQTPTKTLLKLMRGEALDFKEGHTALMAQAAQLQSDRLLTLPSDRTPERLEELRQFLGALEILTRPLVETLATVLVELDVEDRVQLAVRELADVLTYQSYGMLRNGHAESALRTYPAQLVLHAAATAAFHTSDPTLFGILLHHTRQHADIQGVRNAHHLASVLSVRPLLDQLMLLIESGHLYQASVIRIQNLLLRADWMGGVMPVIDRERLFSWGEAFLTLGYLAAAQNAGVEQPAALNPAWWRYFEADDTLRRAVSKTVLSQNSVLRATTARRVVTAFDQMPRTGPVLLRTSASDILTIQEKILGSRQSS